MDPSPTPPPALNLSPPFDGQNLGTDLLGRPIKTKPDDDKDKDKLKTTTSVFAQMLTVLKFVNIQQIIVTSESDKWSKKFNTMDHLTSLLYAQYAGVSSLRELENGLAIFRGEINHMGMDYCPGRSTLAYANEHRDYRVFERIFHELAGVVGKSCGDSRSGRPKAWLDVDIGGRLYAIDSSTIDLTYSMFDHALFRRSKGGIKLHPLLEHDVYLPVWAHITEAKIHDRKILETIDPVLGLPRGSFVAVDRAYNDYAMLFGWQQKEINFVCRAKDNMSYVVTENLDVPKKEGKPAEGEEPRSYVIADQTVTLAGKEASKDYPKELRVVSYWIHEKKGNRRVSRKVRFFTNNLRLSASMIANIYKSRWQIEAFFKLIKQNLKIKSFLGTSPNAVKTQVYVALIAVLILRHLQASLKVQWCVPHMLATIRLILHLHRSLSGWLDRDHGASPRSPRVRRAPPGGAAGTACQPAG